MNLKKDTDFKKQKYEIEFTEQCIEEMTEIYDYISKNLKENIIANKIINKINNKILNLAENPEIYMKIGKTDKLKREYHRIIIKNYVILYTIDYFNKKVFISRIIYGRRNYLN